MPIRSFILQEFLVQNLSVRNAVAITLAVTGKEVECITGDDEEEGFFFSENITEDILGITSVHPIREDIIMNLIKRRKADFKIVTKLLDSGDLVKYKFEGKSFYRRYENIFTSPTEEI